MKVEDNARFETVKFCAFITLHFCGVATVSGQHDNYRAKAE